MARILGWALLAIGTLSVASASAQTQGESLFQRTCIACHTINGGRLVGPDLENIRNRRDEAWIDARLTDPACRLLTVLGPGGMGKSRLAIQAAGSNCVFLLVFAVACAACRGD